MDAYIQFTCGLIGRKNSYTRSAIIKTDMAITDCGYDEKVKEKLREAMPDICGEIYIWLKQPFSEMTVLTI